METGQDPPGRAVLESLDLAWTTGEGDIQTCTGDRAAGDQEGGMRPRDRPTRTGLINEHLEEAIMIDGRTRRSGRECKKPQPRV